MTAVLCPRNEEARKPRDGEKIKGMQRKKLIRWQEMQNACQHETGPSFAA